MTKYPSQIHTANTYHKRCKHVKVIMTTKIIITHIQYTWYESTYNLVCVKNTKIRLKCYSLPQSHNSFQYENTLYLRITFLV